MRKVVRNNTVYFYDDMNFEKMYLDYSTDECVWHFNSDDIITISKDMEFYDYLNEFMSQNYKFYNDVLCNYKDENKLIWYSDCYYDPDNTWSVDSVSCLHIERVGEQFNVWYTKRTDAQIDRFFKHYDICFSPLGNGKYSRNLDTNMTLQDDFVMFVYQPLLENSKKKVIK